MLRVGGGALVILSLGLVLLYFLPPFGVLPPLGGEFKNPGIQASPMR